MAARNLNTGIRRRIAGLAMLAGACGFSVPAPAQNWGVQPAPPSWGLPPNPPQATPQNQPRQQPPPPASRGAQQASIAATAQTDGWNQALGCAAALQVATLASPSWGREPGITAATNRWLERAFAEAPGAGVPGDQVRAAVEQEMNRQVSEAAANPSLLSRRAFECASLGA